MLPWSVTGFMPGETRVASQCDPLPALPPPPPVSSEPPSLLIPGTHGGERSPRGGGIRRWAGRIRAWEPLGGDVGKEPREVRPVPQEVCAREWEEGCRGGVTRHVTSRHVTTRSECATTSPPLPLAPCGRPDFPR